MNLASSRPTSPGRRTALRATAAAALCASPLASWAQSGADSPWRLLVNEGVSADLSIAMLAQRYRSWADYLGAQIRFKVVADPVIDVRRFLQQAQSDQKPLLVFGKSVNQLAKLVRDNGYQPLVRRPEPYKTAFIVPKGSTIQAFPQLAGRKLLLPDEFSASTALAKAEIRRAGIREPYLSYTRYHDMVTSQVSAGVADAGVVSPAVAKKWKEAGGMILAETQPVVNWSVLASPKAPADMVAKLTDSLLAMNSQSSSILSDIGVNQWTRAEKAEYLALLDYTGE